MGNRAVITIDPVSQYQEQVKRNATTLDYIKNKLASYEKFTAPEDRTDSDKANLENIKAQLQEAETLQAELLANPLTTATQKSIDDQIGLYLHWNGGKDSVQAFLKYCKLQGFRSPESDCYGYARLAQVTANAFPDGLCVGMDTCKHLDCDNYDNGVYLIKDWEIVGRMYHTGAEQLEYNELEFLIELDKDQPQAMQLGAEKITAKYHELQGVK